MILWKTTRETRTNGYYLASRSGSHWHGHEPISMAEQEAKTAYGMTNTSNQTGLLRREPRLGTGRDGNECKALRRRGSSATGCSASHFAPNKTDVQSNRVRPSPSKRLGPVCDKARTQTAWGHSNRFTRSGCKDEATRNS